MIIRGGFLLFPREQMENGVLLFFVDFFMVSFLFKSLNQSEDSTVNDKVCSNVSALSQN